MEEGKRPRRLDRLRLELASRCEPQCYARSVCNCGRDGRRTLD